MISLALSRVYLGADAYPLQQVAYSYHLIAQVSGLLPVHLRPIGSGPFSTLLLFLKHLF